MKKIVFILSLLACQSTVFGQLGVGTNSPDASAQLDVTATDKGFLAPRIALTSATDVTTIATPATGLMIYNTATAGTSPNDVIPGYYYYDGTKWVRFINSSQESKWSNVSNDSLVKLNFLSDGVTARTGNTNFRIHDRNALIIGDISPSPGSFFSDKSIVAKKTGNNSLSLIADGGIYSSYGAEIYGGSSIGAASYLTLMKYRGSATSPAVVQTGDLIGIIDFRGGTGVGTGFVNGARIITAVDGTVNTSLSPASIPMSFDFLTVAPGQTAPNSRLKIASNGNVGIDNSTPFINLSVGSSNLSQKIGRAIINANGVHASDKRDALSIGRWDGSTGYNEFLGIKYNVSDGASVGEGNDNHAFLTFHTWGNNISGSIERMRLDQRGRLGIGTNSPQNHLDVRSGADFIGSFHSTNIWGAGLLINPTATGGTQTALYSTANSNSLGGGKFIIIHNNISALTIDNLGNTGIGNVSPTQKLDVNGSGLFRRGNASNGFTNSQLIFGFNGTNTHQHSIKTRHNASAQAGNAIDFYTWDYGTNSATDLGTKHIMTLDGNGNVGIGTATPGNKLTVIGNARFTPNTNNNATGEPVTVEIYGRVPTAMGTQVGGLKMSWYSSAAGIEVIRPGAATGAGLAFNYAIDSVTSPTREGFRLMYNGNIGIGSTNPGSKLEVNGSATNSVAFNAGSGTSIDFSKSNLAYTTASAGAFTITNIKNGGTYTLAVQGATSGTASFTCSGYTFISVNNGITAPNKHTLYTFIVMGSTVYVYMATGF